MTLTDRDRRIVKILLPILVLGAYWFLLLSPKREEAGKAGEQLAQQQERRDSAEARASRLGSAKQGFAADYVEFVRLGKAVPNALDLPGLIIQLEQAARGTGIRFSRVASPEGAGATTAAPAASGAKPAAGGGAPASSSPGKTTEKADEAANPTAGGGSPGASGSAGAAGVQTAPLELEFGGGFFELADFFSRLEGFVATRGSRLAVKGRLVTIDAVKLSSDEESFPALKAEVKATVYLSPRAKTGAASPGAPGGAGTTEVKTP
jgi:hypothetical protein